jgi:hypothetical protein
MKTQTIATKQSKQCRYCERPIPFLRSLFSPKFCSAAHERLSQHEMDGKMMERLAEAAQRLPVTSSTDCETALPGV